MTLAIKHSKLDDFVLQKVAQQLRSEVSNITPDLLVPNPDLILAQWKDEVIGIPVVIDPLHKCISANKFTVQEVIDWIKKP